MNPLPETWTAAIWQLGNSEPLIAQIWLFGSRAKRTNRNDSDLDLAFMVTGKTHGEAFANWCFEAETWEARLSAAIPVKLDLRCAFPDDDIVMPAVKSHGIKIYP